jgi:FkbM family methyltransferase
VMRCPDEPCAASKLSRSYVEPHRSSDDRTAKMIQRILQRAVRSLPRPYRLRVQTELDLRNGTVEVELRRLAEYLPANRRRAALDIGANNGVTTSVLSRMFDQVHAFEPNPTLATEWFAAAPANVTAWPYALSNRDGEATLNVPGIGKLVLTGWASLGAPGLENVDRMESMAVPCRRLDSLGLEELPVDFIKIDVEGHELAVLEGGETCILRWRPWFIVEVWERQQGAVLRLFEQWQYETFSLASALGIEVASQNLVLRPKRS